MKHLKVFILLAAMAAGATELIHIPLSLTQTNPFVYSNAVWWTNSYYTNSAFFTNEVWWTNSGWETSPPTGIQTWMGWWAMKENLNRITNTLDNLETNAFNTTNAPSAGDALRYDGTNLYWAP